MLTDSAPFAVATESTVLSKGWCVHKALDDRICEAGVAEVAVSGQHVVMLGEVDFILR